MIEYDRIKLGKLLKDAREKTSLTQNEVARKLGYSSPQFISNIERGVSVAPLPLLSKLAALYKMNVDAIVNIIVDSQKDLLRSSLKKSRR